MLPAVDILRIFSQSIKILLRPRKLRTIISLTRARIIPILVKTQSHNFLSNYTYFVAKKIDCAPYI